MEMKSNGRTLFMRVGNEAEKALADAALISGREIVKRERTRNIAIKGNNVSIENKELSIPDGLFKNPDAAKPGLEGVEYPFDYSALDTSRIIKGLWSAASFTPIHSDN